MGLKGKDQCTFINASSHLRAASVNFHRALSVKEGKKNTGTGLLFTRDAMVGLCSLLDNPQQPPPAMVSLAKRLF